MVICLARCLSHKLPHDQHLAPRQVQQLVIWAEEKARKEKSSDCRRRRKGEEEAKERDFDGGRDGERGRSGERFFERDRRREVKWNEMSMHVCIRTNIEAYMTCPGIHFAS